MEHSLKSLYRVTTLYGSEWTYTQVAALEPDVILLDVHMPVEGGFDGRQLRRPRFASTPIIFLTGSEKVGDFGAISKPGARALPAQGHRPALLLAALGEEMVASNASSSRLRAPMDFSPV